MRALTLISTLLTFALCTVESLRNNSENFFPSLAAKRLWKCDSCTNFSENFKVFPEFDESASIECKLSHEIYKKSLKSFNLWALQMYDARAKLPSGILNGNLNQLGDFDQCLDVIANEEMFRGKYCLAQIMLDVPREFEFLTFLRRSALGQETFPSQFSDISHIVPKLSEIKWALCIPSTCSANDAQLSLQNSLAALLADVPVSVNVQVNETMCQVRDNGRGMDFATKATILLFVVLSGVIVVGTVIEVFFESGGNEYLLAFSLKRNVKDLLSTKADRGDMPSIHFIRTIFSMLIFFAHRAFEEFFYPLSGQKRMVTFMTSPFMTLIRASFMYTEIFIMISGFLVTYSLIGKLQRGHRINIIKEIFGRYFRLMPPVLMLILFTTFILPLMGRGPLWPMLIEHQAKVCKGTAWRNVFMVQNLMGIEEICIMNTHHVATDYQLSVTAPFFVILLYWYPVATSAGIIAMGVISAIGRFIVTYNLDLSLYIDVDMRVTEFFKVSDNLYFLPFYRFSVYAIGILLAYALRKNKGSKMTDHQLNLGWALAAVNFIAAAYVAVSAESRTTLSAAIYASVSSIAFCLCFAWVIYTSELGYKNIFSSIIEWKYWKPAANLSYSIYLVQFLVFHYNIGVRRHSSPFIIYGQLIDIHEMIVIVLSATALTLFIDYPIRNLKNLLLDQRLFKLSISSNNNNNKELKHE